jgi:predicted dinucleotide-binding enzyme
VFFGARTAEKGQSVAALAQHRTQGGTNDEAAAFGDVLLYSARGIDPAEVLRSIAVLTGKILIDPNNWAIPEGFAYQPIAISLAETLAKQVPFVVGNYAKSASQTLLLRSETQEAALTLLAPLCLVVAWLIFMVGEPDRKSIRFFIRGEP